MKSGFKNYGTLVTMLTLLFLPQVAAAGGAGGDAAAQESILDRLEKRLLEKDGSSFYGGTSSKDGKKRANTSYTYNKSLIGGMPGASKDIKDINKAIEDLEEKVEFLSAGVHAVKQKILQDAKINNHISIAAILEKKDLMSFKTITVKIDGHTVYEQNSSLGLWLLEKSVPLFHGPIQPGKHRIDFDATLVQKKDKVLPLVEGTHHKVTQSFNFDVPAGKIQKKWHIEIAKADPKSAKTMASFKVVK